MKYQIKQILILSLFTTLFSCGKVELTQDSITELEEIAKPDNGNNENRPYSQEVVDSLDEVEWFDTAKPLSGLFYNTFYYLKEEPLNVPASTKTKAVRTPSGQVLAYVTPRFKELMDIEGSGKLADGRVINYAGVKEGEIRYLPTVHSWGRGTGNCALKPFRVVAVDRNVIPLGSIVFIKESVGMKLPDGTLHDGYWLAGDVGGAIKDRHLDLFIGSESWSKFLYAQKIGDSKKLNLSIVGRATAKSCKYQRAK